MDLCAELGLAAASAGTPIFVVMFVLLFAGPKFAQQEPYLKRVAKKYSMSALNLR
jgi:hypothetical protein